MCVCVCLFVKWVGVSASWFGKEEQRMWDLLDLEFSCTKLGTRKQIHAA